MSVNSSNCQRLIDELDMASYEELHQWSVLDYEAFWQCVIERLHIKFDTPYTMLCDVNDGIEQPRWFVDATLNIANSCFTANPSATAVIEQTAQGHVRKLSYQELNALSNQVANSLQALRLPYGTAIAVNMVMTAEAAAIYLGIIKAGHIVVSIADSFSADEITTRLGVTNTQLIFTQDVILRGGKQLPLYEKVRQSGNTHAIVLPAQDKLTLSLQNNDISWQDFLVDNTKFTAVTCEPMASTNYLFSSGTTGTPKVIPWNHTTPLKAGSDAHFHQDIHPNDVLCWPTNLGWMMGPWLIYAALLNQAAIALYDDSPLTREFGEFVQNQSITMLGLVPSMVKTWRSSGCMEGLDWSSIRTFSSSGECSNTDDMTYLMQLADNQAPIVEYCGGTETGGGYITSTLCKAIVPSTFNCKALGIDWLILDENGKETNNGEIALIPPSIGLSTTLLNRDHHATYYAEMPTGPHGETLRRHGDQIQYFPEYDYYRALGRADDTMNLGAIKISSAEIERCINQLANIEETAAIAVNPPGGGPSQLVIYVVLANQTSHDELKQQMQQQIKTKLNPLFKIHDVVIIEQLPRTASNKIMRRELREQYQ